MSNEKENGHAGIQMTPDQVDKMIIVTEQEITRQVKELQPLAVQRNDAKLKMEQAEDDYATARRVHDELARAMEQNKELLQNLADIKAGKRGGSFRLMRGGSHTDAKKKREVSWMQTAIDILLKENQFLKLEVLVEKCANMHANKFEAVRIKAAKYSMADQFKKQCIANKDNPERRTFQSDRLIEWNDKIGLQSWLGTDGRPQVKYIKAFVYSDNGKESVPQ